MGGTRSYTNEQIQFVLDAWIDGKKAPEIVQAYRQAFGDQRFGVSQVKYLKSAYGEDAEFGVPLVNRVMRPSSATDSATHSARTLAGASLSQRGYGRPPMRPVVPSAGSTNQQLPVSAQHQPAGFPARLASEPAPLATMPGFDFGGPSFSGGGSGLVAAPGLAATNAGTIPAAAGMSTTGGSSGPRSVQFGATRPPHGPVAQGGGPGSDTAMTGNDSIMIRRPMSGPGGAFWGGPGQGAADMRSATAPFGSTSDSTPDAAMQMTAPAPTGFPSSSAGLAGQAPAGGDEKPFLLAPALERGLSEDWVVLSPLAGPSREEEDHMIGWHSKSHHGCPIEAKHRHDADGGIHFGGMRDLRHAMAAHLCSRLEEVSRLERRAQGEEERAEQQYGDRAGVPEPSTAPGSVAGESTAMEQYELEG